MSEKLEETLFINYLGSPDDVVHKSYPHKLILAKDGLEYFQNRSATEKDAEGISNTYNIDYRGWTSRESIDGVDFLFDNFEQMYQVNIYCVSDRIRLRVADKKQGAELYEKLLAWRRQ